LEAVINCFWPTLAILILWRLKKEDHEFKPSLSCLVTSYLKIKERNSPKEVGGKGYEMVIVVINLIKVKYIHGQNAI
jgi:hypothetical protein